jgi:phage-related protein
MAGNQVVLTLTGDTKQLEDSFTRVGGASKDMGTKVGQSTKHVDDHAGGLKRVGEAADNSERNIIGIHDVIDGTATIMQGPGKQGIVAYIQGWADLAGGLAPLVLTLADTKIATVAQTVASKAAQAATKVWAGAQWLMNTALLASPITWIVLGIVLLIGIIILIATKTDWFQRAWKVAWGWIKHAASGAWDFIKKIPGWIGTAFKKIVGFISSPFKTAFNAIADAWNNTVGRLSFTFPSWVPGIGGNKISVPHIPKFHSGGVVGGVPGSEQLAILQAGERVTAASGSSGGAEIVIRSGGSKLDDLLVEVLAGAIKRRGGNVQAVLGFGRG